MGKSKSRARFSGGLQIDDTADMCMMYAEDAHSTCMFMCDVSSYSVKALERHEQIHPKDSRDSEDPREYCYGTIESLCFISLSSLLGCLTYFIAASLLLHPSISPKSF